MAKLSQAVRDDAIDYAERTLSLFQPEHVVIQVIAQRYNTTTSVARSVIKEAQARLVARSSRSPQEHLHEVYTVYRSALSELYVRNPEEQTPQLLMEVARLRMFAADRIVNLYGLDSIGVPQPPEGPGIRELREAVARNPRAAAALRELQQALSEQQEVPAVSYSVRAPEKKPSAT